MKPYSIYFPQFYPIPTNDKAWGVGFTDWTLVANANLRERWSRRAPLRGFYDGADSLVHSAQMEEMVASGLGGMAVYHYWFYTHQELSAFEQTLLNGGDRNDLPWFLIWASEDWSRRWLGDSSRILTLNNEPSRADIELHCHYLLACFERPSYFRWCDRPLFVWYNLDHFKFPEKVIKQYRECFQALGVEVAMGSFLKKPFENKYSTLTDVTYLFEPRLFFHQQRLVRSVAKPILDVSKRLFGENVVRRLLISTERVRKGRIFSAQEFLDYWRSQERLELISSLPGSIQEVLSPGWNNTPRYGEYFTALEDIRPEYFSELINTAKLKNPSLPPLINAWNEWSEGAAIEPCAYFGRRYLDMFI
jgi:hypothetical protein